MAGSPHFLAEEDARREGQEKAERMTVRQFLALGPNEQPSVMAAEGLWKIIGELEAVITRKDERIEGLTAALEPFAFYRKERLRLHPNAAKTDSNIPDLTYGRAKIGDKHFRAADAALSPDAGKEGD